MSELEKFDKHQASLSQDNFHNVAAPVVRITNQAQDAIDRITEKRETLLQRLFPDDRTRAVIAGELRLVKTEFEFRKRALQAVRETQIQSLTEVCNQYLIKQKAASRADTANFLLSKRLEVENEMNAVFETFISKMDQKMAEVGSIKSLYLQEVRQRQLDKDIEGFVELYCTLMDKFQQIASEGV